MHNPELYFALDFATMFCECCEDNNRKPDRSLAFQFSQRMHLVGEAREDALGEMSRDEVERDLALAKCLLDHYSLQEHGPKEFGLTLAMGELNRKVEDQLADVVTTMRDFLEKRR